MSILTDASLIITPNAVKSGSLLAVVPSNGNGDLTWTRNSGATRVNSAGLIENVLANVPRLDYSLGGCPSILLEPQRTNLALRSGDFSNAVWSKLSAGVGITPIVTANTAIAPDDLISADRIQLNLNNGTTANDLSYISQGLSAEASVFSIYLKSNTSNCTIYLRASGTTLNINLTTQWKRFEVASSTSVTQIQFGLRGGTGTSNYVDIAAWGAQLEQGSYPTSYIPTVASTVTRVADVGSVLTAPLGLTSITATFADNTTNVITTIPSTYQLPLGRIKTIVGL